MIKFTYIEMMTACLLVLLLASAVSCQKSKSGHLMVSELINSREGVDSLSSPTSKGQYEEYLKNRQKLVEHEHKSYFTFDVGELSPQEKFVDEALQKFRSEVVQGDHSPLLLDFFEGKTIIENSRLLHALELVPKGAHLHLHVEAGISIPEVVKFTTNDFVYYNMEKNLLKTAPNGLDIAGYEKCNKLRREWTGPGTFDEYLENKLLLQPSEIDPRESRHIWDNFQYKFMLIDGVIHYHEFYKTALKTIARNAIKDGVRILEIRHASGRIFNDNCGKNYQETTDNRSGIACISADPEYLSLSEEFDLYQQVIQEIKSEEPNFELRLIVVAFKAAGKQGVLNQLKSYQYAMDNGLTFVTGFDLVNEEDVTDPILNFVEDILEAKNGYPNFNLYLHAGESTSRFNENLYDAVLLGAKRIGHGVGINFHPQLTELVKSQNIGYEVCPISNLILSYTLDMRWHPIRYLMANGVGVTLSSDDPSFWGYDKLSLDFAYAVVGWQLDLKDIKQLAINSIKHSSIESKLKDHYLRIFKEDWDRFINRFATLDFVSE